MKYSVMLLGTELALSQLMKLQATYSQQIPVTYAYAGLKIIKEILYNEIKYKN